MGSTKTITIYVRNEGNQGVVLSKALNNWNPTTLSNYIALSWNYANQVINPSATLTVTLSLNVATNTPATSNFSFDTIITAMSN